MSNPFMHQEVPKPQPSRRPGGVERANRLLDATAATPPSEGVSNYEQARRMVGMLRASIESHYLKQLSPAEYIRYHEEGLGMAKESVAAIKSRLSLDERKEHKEGVEELREKYPWLMEAKRPPPSVSMAVLSSEGYLQHMLHCLEIWEERLEQYQDE